MFKFYGNMLEKNPILTKSTTNGIIMSIADYITQTVFQKQPFDIKRNLDLFFISFCYGAPILHFWYCKILPKIRLTFFPNVSKPVNVFFSMILDELAFAPLLYGAFYPTYQIISDRDFNSFGKGTEVCKQKICWKIWPLASSLNFWFVPIKYQVLFANIVGLFWNMIVSHLATK